MAGELKHASVGTSITQAEFEAVSTHTLDGITNGDVLYADGTNIKRLAKGTDGDFLSSGTPPSWVTHATTLTGIHGEINTKMTSDQTVNDSTTLVNITELVAALEANSYYTILSALTYTTGAIPDIKWAWVVPSGATFQVVNRTIDLGADRTQTVSGTASGVSADGSQDVIMSMGWVYTGVTAGNLQPQFAQTVQNASDTKMLKGSWLMVKKV